MSNVHAPFLDERKVAHRQQIFSTVGKSRVVFVVYLLGTSCSSTVSIILR